MILLLSFLSSNIAFSKDVIRLGFLEYPPYIYSVDGKVKGSLLKRVEDFQQIVKKIITLVSVPALRAKSRLKNNHIDGFVSLVKTPERMTFLYFTDFIVETINPRICSLSKFEFKTIESFFKSVKKNDYLVLMRSKYLLKLFKPIKDKIILSYTGNYRERAYRLLQSGRAKYSFFSTSEDLEKDLYCHNIFSKSIEVRISINLENKKLISYLKSLKLQ